MDATSIEIPLNGPKIHSVWREGGRGQKREKDNRKRKLIFRKLRK
jgi:hypothetical protein